MQCPKCKSKNTQRLEVIYEHGTSDINTTSNTVGVGYGGRLGAGGAVTKTSGTSQSIIAQKASPPEIRSYSAVIWCSIIGLILLFNAEGFWQLVGLGFVVLAIYMGKANFEYNKSEFPKLFEEWEKSWYCNKCGNIYFKK